MNAIFWENLCRGKMLSHAFLQEGGDRTLCGLNADRGHLVWGQDQPATDPRCKKCETSNEVFASRGKIAT